MKIHDLKQKLDVLRLEEPLSEKVVDTLNDLGYAYHFVNPDMSEEYAIQAREAAICIGYSIGEDRSFNVTGIARLLKTDYQGAMDWFRRHLLLSRKIGFKAGEASALSNYGLVYKNLGDYGKSLEYYLQATGIQEEIGDEYGLATSFINMGTIYQVMKDYSRAHDLFRKALAIFQGTDQTVHISAALANIASLILEEGRTDDVVLDYINKSLELRRNTEDVGGLANSYSLLGVYHREIGNYGEALELFGKALEIFQSLDFRNHVAGTSIDIGRTKSLMKDYEGARESLQKGIEIAVDIKSRKLEADGYLYLSELYQALGDFEHCYKYYKTYRDLKEEIARESTAAEIARKELLHDIEKKEKENEIHRLKNIDLEREIDERKRAEECLRISEDRFRQLSIEDVLTGLFNRRYLFEQGRKRVERCVTDGGHICLAMLDIDHFKVVNDKYGHQTGDYVLREFAKIASGCIRPDDFAARYGGEEFVLLMRDCGLDAAYSIVERIRDAVENRIFRYEGHEVSITVSCGLAQAAEVIPCEDALEELIKLGDSRLYTAKEAGRNRVVCQN